MVAHTERDNNVRVAWSLDPLGGIYYHPDPLFLRQPHWHRRRGTHVAKYMPLVSYHFGDASFTEVVG